jgi:hypothetical protein
MKKSIAVLPLLALAAACANTYDNQQPFNRWVNQVSQACYYQNIGTYQVGSLIDSAATNQGNYFLDQLERAFDGKITPNQFVSGVTSFLVGRESDPGVQCVVSRIPPKRPMQ